MREHRQVPGFEALGSVGTDLRLARRPLVGRTQELARLSAMLARVVTGEGGAILISGDPGIGKTRLAEEILNLARARGFQVLEGHAYALEATLAYGPILDAFGPLLRRLGRPRLQSLVADLSDLGRLFGDLPVPEPVPLGDSSLEKTRLFDAFTRLLDRLAQEQPAVLFVDDLHWADPATLELLHYLSRSLVDGRVLLLATYRSHEITMTRELTALVTSLRRIGLVQELSLSRLPSESVAELAQGILGGRASVELLDLLQNRADGVPLFVEGLLRALLDAGQLLQTEAGWTMGRSAAAVLPTSVRDLILERLGQLEPTERRLVDLLAVGGTAVSHAELLEASQMEEELLVADLGRLRQAGILAEGADDSRVVYHLTHPLIQEVAYAELPEIERRRTHGALARAAEVLRPDDLDLLARHYGSAAGIVDPDRALEVLLAAGERARAVHAAEQASRHFESALRLARDGHRVELLPLLLERLGEAWERVGEGGAAVALWSEAIDEHERLGDARSVARLRRLAAAVEWERGRWVASQEHLALGLAAVESLTPTQERADLLLAHATMLRRRNDIAALGSVVSELHDVGERLDSSRARAEAFLAEVELHDALGEHQSAMEKGLAGLAVAQAADDQLLVFRAHDLLSVIALLLGDHQSARHHSESSLKTARHLGAPTLESRALVNLAWEHLAAGTWEMALRHSAQGLALARRVGRSRAVALALSARSVILARLGNLTEAGACVAEARRAWNEVSAPERLPFTGADLAEAILALDRADPERARVAAEAVAISSSRGGPRPLGLAILAEAQAALGDGRTALAIADEVDQLGAEPSPYRAGLAAHAEGVARAVLGEGEAALACFERAAEIFAGLEMPFETARTRLAWAEWLARDSSDGAADAARASLAVFERLGARLYADRSRRLLRNLGVHLPPVRRARPTDGPLSPREREVARLVAERLSNAEIASRLVVSPRTVTTHLERIYSRLGISSRAELARYVIESGLVSPTDQVA